MKTLTIVPQPAPDAAPDLNTNGVVKMTALVTPKRGDAFYLCNPMDEIIEARKSGEPFVAHRVIGMQAKRILIEPGVIATVREL